MITRILIATGDSTLRQQIVTAAENENHLTEEAPDGISALKHIRRNLYQAVILDTDLPEIGGLTVCREIRKLSNVPVIMLSSLSSEKDRLQGFLSGGNDYMVKPIYISELMARVASFIALTAAPANKSDLITVGELTVDSSSRNVYINRKKIRLTPKEYDLLYFLCQNRNRAFSRDTLLDQVWGRGFYGTDRTVDTHIKSLRRQIKPHQDCIVTVWGFGYKLTDV